MSYEGYQQCLCAKGHYRAFDAFFELEESKCSCGAPIVFVHQVDQTNDEGVALTFECDKPAVTETCPCCGNVKVLEEETFKIPTKV